MQHLATAAAVAMVGINSTQILAADHTWSATPASGNWNVAGNWVGGLPASNTATDLYFGSSTQTALSQNIATPMIVNSLTFMSGASAFTFSGSGFSLDNGITITQSSSSTKSFSNTFTGSLAGTNTLHLTGDGTGVVTMGSDLDSSGANIMTLLKTGTSTYVLSDTGNTYSGVTINGGVISVGADTHLGTAAGAITLGGGTLRLTAGVTISSTRAFSLTSATSSSIETTTGTSTYTSAITGTGALAKLGPGTFTLSGASGAISAASQISVNGGSLTLDNGTVNGNRIGDSTAVSLGGGVLQFLSAGAAPGVNEAVGAFSLDGSDSTLGLTSSVTAGRQTRVNVTDFTRNDRGTALIRGSNLGQGTGASYASPATGTSYLKISDSSNESAFVLTLVGTNSTTYSASTTNMAIVPYLLGDASGTGPGDTFVTYIGTGGTGGGSTGQGFIQLVDSNYAAAFPGSVSDNNVRIGTNSFSVSPPAGTMNSLLFQQNGTVGGSNLQIITSGAVAMVETGASTTIVNPPLQFGTTGSLREGVLTVSGGTLTLNGALTTTEGITKAGTGVLNLGAAATYSGQVTINNGTLRSTIADIIPDSSAVVMSSSATLNLNNNAETIGSLRGAGTVTLGSAALTAGGNDASTTFSGVISGAGNFTKTGAGTFRLSGASTYTGTTTVSNGALLINGTHTGGNSYTVASGATIGGNGAVTLASTRTLTLDGTVSPGDAGVGHLTVTTSGAGSGTTFNAGGMYEWNLADAGSTAGVGWDLLSLSSLSISAMGPGAFTIKLIASSPANFNIHPPFPPGNYEWTIVSSGSAITGFDATKFTLDTTAFTPIAAGGSFHIGLAAGNTQLRISYVPEPGLATIAIGAFGLLARRTRRRIA